MMVILLFRHTFLLLLSAILCCQGTIGNDSHVSSTLNFDEMYAFLRHDDKRLVRYNVPTEEAEDRQLKTCSKYLNDLMDFLLVSSEGRSIDDIINDKLKIIKILTLCSSENPTFRQKIGIYKDGKVLKEVISMIDEGDKAAAIAGEAIWIFSFNNLHNHNYFVDNGAIPKMSEIIVTKGKNDKDHNAILAVMWVAAALQNLAASYCDTDSGHCWWEFDDNEDGGLYLHDDSPLVTDGTKAAKEIIKSGLRNDNGDDGENELINIMKSLACREPMTEDDRMWPSLATIDDEITDSRITSWAIVGILKNLSMYSASVHATLSSEDCLCSLTESEDWLESSKAEDALYRLGIVDCWGEDEDETNEL